MTNHNNPRDDLATPQEPENSDETQSWLDEAIAGQYKTKLRDMFQLFHDISRAATLPEEEQTTALQESIDLILSDPGLTNTMLESFNDLRPELPAFAPDLPAMRNDQPDLMQEHNDAWAEHLTASMRAILAEPRAIPGPDPAQQDRFDLPDAAPRTLFEHGAFDLALRGEPNLKDNSDQSLEDTGDDPYAVITMFSADDAGTYLLGLTLTPDSEDPQQVQVTLELRSPVTREWLVDARDQWNVQASLDGDALLIVPDEFDDLAWRIGPLVSRDDLPRLNFEVNFVFPEDA